MIISATTPVTVPATSAITYNLWYLTQLIGKFSPTKAPCVINLNRSATIDGTTVLMPQASGSQISFSCDLWAEAAADPNIAALATTAQADILALVIAIANKRNLL